MRIIHRLGPIVALAAFVPAAALAQSGGGAGAVGIIGGPVGAAKGIDTTITTIAAVPPSVEEWVTKAPAPTAVTLPGNLVVGATLPKTVVLMPVPVDLYTEQSPTTFSYAYLNGHKVIVDDATLKVVAILGG
jgi:hypothetical protein